MAKKMRTLQKPKTKPQRESKEHIFGEAAQGFILNLDANPMEKRCLRIPRKDSGQFARLSENDELVDSYLALVGIALATGLDDGLGIHLLSLQELGHAVDRH